MQELDAGDSRNGEAFRSAEAFSGCAGGTRSAQLNLHKTAQIYNLQFFYIVRHEYCVTCFYNPPTHYTL